VALVAAEYAVAPQALWRDVLPTAAHRWIVRQDADIRALDCMPLTSQSQSIQWLTKNRVQLSSRSPSDCSEPNFSDTLAAGGYTHLVVRRNTAEGRWFASNAVAGFRTAADFDDGMVLAVTAAYPLIYTTAMPEFFRREHNARGTWRWMAKHAAWSITNTGLQPIVATLDIELWAFQHARTVELRLDRHHVQSVGVTQKRRIYQIGPLTIPPGDHALTFQAVEAPTSGDGRSGSANQRAVSIAVGTWRWTVRGDQE
jgi:hypothetical protein